MRVAAVQTTAGAVRDENLESAGALVADAASRGAELVVLPELFSVAGSPTAIREAAEDLSGPTTTWAADLARRHRLHLLAGSFPERAADGRVHNTSCLVDPAGSVVAVYRKVHLFDLSLGDTQVRESATFAAGDRLCVAPLAPSSPAVLGLSICYDLRFPELYRTLSQRGATVVAVPAAFTAATGAAHWEVLLRARAIENQAYVVAAGQVGRLPPGMPDCHGHSMIVDPWGTIVAEREDASPGIVLADVDLEHLARVRSELPVLAHRRPDAYLGSDDRGDGGRTGVDGPRPGCGGGERERGRGRPHGAVG